jgi:hypothetical protein
MEAIFEGNGKERVMLKLVRQRDVLAQVIAVCASTCSKRKQYLLICA